MHKIEQYWENKLTFSLNDSIEVLGLSARAKNALMGGGFKTIRDFISGSDVDFLKLENLGMKSLNEIREKRTIYALPSNVNLPKYVSRYVDDKHYVTTYETKFVQPANSVQIKLHLSISPENHDLHIGRLNADDANISLFFCKYTGKLLTTRKIEVVRVDGD